MKSAMVAVLFAVSAIGAAFAQGAPSSPGAKVYFVNLADGAAVAGPFKVVFGLSGEGVAPAGVEKEGTGHRHLPIDRPPMGQGEEGAKELLYSVTTDDNHRHFGGGQTETTVELVPGTHTLQLVPGDRGHVQHTPPVMSEVITIAVEYSGPVRTRVRAA